MNKTNIGSKKWCRAVWKEGEQEEEGVIPEVWVVGKNVMWPRGVNALRAMNEHRVPEEKRDTFSLVKVKCTSGMMSPFSLLKSM